MAARAPLTVEERNTRLVEAGNELLQLQLLSSKEELLEKLDNLEHLLLMVEQVPPASARAALLPATEALIADGLLRHTDIDVKVSVASCISQIMRISAPEQPCDDDKAKDFFELAVLAFGKLSCMGDRCYSKAVSILEILMKYRSGVLMLDLELDALVVQMFQHFLNSIRPDQPDHVVMDIEQMMSMIILESDIIPVELLTILISSVKKENQNVSPRSYTLGERVLGNCAVKIRACLPDAMRSLSISTDNYSEVVELIWPEAIKSAEAIKSEVTNAVKPLPSSRLGEIDQYVDGISKPQVENGCEEPCHKVARFDDVSPIRKVTSKCLEDTDSKVAAADDNVVLFGTSVDNTLKLTVNNDPQELSHNASYDKVGLSLHGLSKSTNDDSIEGAADAACEKVTAFSDQPSDLPEKDDSKHEEKDTVPETDKTLKESQCGDAMEQHKSTDSRTSSRPEKMGFIYAVDKELDGEATQVSKKRAWKPNLLKKPEEGYDHAWLSGERRSKAHIRWKGYRKDTNKRSSCSPKRAISNGLYMSSGGEKAQIMISTKRRTMRRQRDKNDDIGEKDGAKVSSISARDSPGALTKKNVSQPILVSSDKFVILEGLEEEHDKSDTKNLEEDHDKSDTKNLPVRYRDKRRHSSIEESGVQELGSVSITKKSSSAKPSKEQRKRKSSPSPENALGSVSITKRINFAGTSKEQGERKNSPSQEALGSVSITKESNFVKTSKEQRKRKSLPLKKGSVDMVVREHDEDLVGRRVRVWWPLDETFYEGQITSFDSSKKLHMVLYVDGEQEILDLTTERWELVGDNDASDPRQETVHGLSDSSDMRLGCIVDSNHHSRIKKKVLNVDDVVPVLTPGAGSKKTVSGRAKLCRVLNVDDAVPVLTPGAGSKKTVSGKAKLCRVLNVDDAVPVLTSGAGSKKTVSGKAKLCRVKAIDDLTPPSTWNMQHNSTPKEMHENKRIKVEVSESGIEGNPMSGTMPKKALPESPIEDDDACSELVDVHGYKVKMSSAPTLAAIFARYGDIAVNCRYKSPTVRASLLEVVSDVIRKLKTSEIDANFSAIKAMKSVVSDAADAKLEVSWLQQYLDKIPVEEDMGNSSYLMALRENTMLVIQAAKKDLAERNVEVLSAEKRLKRAERRLQEAQSRAGEAERSVKAFEILGEKIQQDIKESKNQTQYQQSRLKNELP